MSRANEIINATNGGLDIIKHYYPQAEECVGTNKAFKIRDERTPSAHIKEYNGVWYVTDFGEEGKGKNGIEICMKEENVGLSEALHILAERYHLSSSNFSDCNKPIINKKNASGNEKEGDFSFEKKDTFSEKELKVWGPKVRQEDLKALSWFSLKSYTKTKKDSKSGQLMTTTIESTERYPIFLRECNTFRKIYQPLSEEKKYRFFYNGDKPQNFINGLDELKKAYMDFNEEERKNFETDPANNGKSYKEQKLDDAVICSGERDSVNCLSMGHHPIWLNSETADLPTEKYNEIMKYVRVLYNIPDIDSTGEKRGNALAQKYIDIKTVRLPKELLNHKDWRGNPKKDLTDYMGEHPNQKDFKNLLKDAMPLRFWETINDDKKSTRISINTLYFLNFLSTNGFGKIKDPLSDEEILVHVDGAIVSNSNANDVRRYVLEWLERRHEDIEVRNAMLNSSRTKESTLNDLPLLPISFKTAEKNCQYFFFKNCCVKVSAEGIETHGLDEIGLYVRDEDIKPYEFTSKEASFVGVKTEDGDWGIEIKNKDSKFFKFIINSSRICWRDEMEIPKEGEEMVNEQYKAEHKFDINGSRLSADQRQKQMKNLASKLYYIGFLLHNYKDASKPYALWLLEDKISSDGVSSGGSGKSFMMQHLKKTTCNMVIIGGKGKKITDNQFLFEEVTASTNVILIDDTEKNLDFSFLYDIITGSLSVNKKHKASKTVDFEDSPKIVITSNYVPTTLGQGSTDRRLRFVIMSDWYHQKTKDNDYKETRQIFDDFGMEIGGPEYTAEIWNNDLNFMMDCVHFYLQMAKENVVIDPPMDKIEKRFARQSVGDDFTEWAEVYFRKDGEHVDKPLIKSEVIINLISSTNKHWTSAGFTKALKTFVKNCEWIESLNPGGGADGRLIVSENGKTIEKIHVQTKKGKI